ncbi:MAG TPA: hypothetical protein VFT87_04095, partial [Candidatus Saccharimonadales bacterium]|nr:hypothetical protein [Candidatus Saccharimonadales bacterium]
SDKTSQAYRQYKMAITYLNVNEIPLGWGPFMYSLKSGDVTLSAEEKQQALDVAEYMAEKSPNNEDVLDALDTTKTVLGSL